MTKTIEIARNLAVDAVEYASRANAILGIRDSGKTYTATLIAEQLFEASIPFFAFDPIGRWRFLRSPGRGKGFPVVVLGGAVPDLPLTPDSAPKMIRAAMQSGVSMVIDLYDVKLAKADWRKIVRSSIETILYENEEHGGGLRHVFLEEAAEFIPQRVYDGQTYAAVEKLARMGGNAGVGVTLINQRAEEVNKAVLELCDNLLLHRQRGKNSLLSLRKWLEAGNVDPPKEITDSIADLPTGECWAWFRDVGKPVRIKVLPKQSFDPNRREMSRKHGAHPQAVNVSEFVARMKAAIEGKKPAPTTVGLRKGGINPPPGPDFVRPAPPPPFKPGAKQVDEKEAKALREENAILRARIAELERVKDRDAFRPPAAAVVRKSDDPGVHPLDMDAIYAEVKRRAAADPGVLQLLRSIPEIEVTRKRETIRMDTAKQPGQLAAMIAEGFFDGARPMSEVVTELKRIGRSVHHTNVSRDLNRLAEQGFLTIESGGFQAVDGMKVNVVEA